MSRFAVELDFDVTETDLRVLKLLKCVSGGHLRMKFYDTLTTTPQIVPYCEQAPVLMWALQRHDRRSLTKLFKAVKSGDVSLTAAMRMCGVNPGLRRLDCSYSKLGSQDAVAAILSLAPFDPLHIANCVHGLKSPKAAYSWICDVASWMNRYRRFEPSVELTEWYLHLAVNQELRTSHVADYFADGGVWDRKWTVENLKRAVDRWDAERQAVAAAKQIMEASKLASSVDYAPLPIEWEVDGFTFRALDTPTLIVNEGKVMRHCVASYWRDVVRGSRRLYSVTGPATADRATLEFHMFDTGSPTMGQLKSHCNAAATPEARAASAKLLAAISKALKAEHAA